MSCVKTSLESVWPHLRSFLSQLSLLPREKKRQTHTHTHTLSLSLSLRHTHSPSFSQTHTQTHALKHLRTLKRPARIPAKKGSPAGYSLPPNIPQTCLMQRENNLFLKTFVWGERKCPISCSKNSDASSLCCMIISYY